MSKIQTEKKFRYSWRGITAAQINLDEFLGTARSLPHRLSLFDT